MTNVMPFSGSGQPPCPRVIRYLEDLLAMAKAGKIQSLAVAHSEQGEMVTHWVNNNEYMALCGAVGWLEYRMHSEKDD